MAIPAIGNSSCHKLVTASARELKGVVSRVVEVEWAKFTLLFSSEIGPFFLNCHI